MWRRAISWRGWNFVRRHSKMRALVPGLLALAVAVVLVPVSAPRGAGAAAPVTLNVYINGDTNIFDLWSKSLLPAFSKRYPQYRTNMVGLMHGNGWEGVLEKLIAAKRVGRTTDVDLWETDPSIVQQGLADGLWVKRTDKLVSNLTKVPAAKLAA